MDVSVKYKKNRTPTFTRQRAAIVPCGQALQLLVMHDVMACKRNMKLQKFMLPIIILLVTTSCATDINYRNANEFANSATIATKAGDWDKARRYWAKAVVNGDLAKMPPQQLAIFNYEYGRALGVQCFWEESEKYLLKALEIDKNISGPTYLSLTELARLKYDQKHFKEAIGYFEKALQSLEKVNASKESSIAFADILTEYADTLKNIGREKESKLAQDRAVELRLKNKQNYSITDRTPYGTKCHTNNR